MSRFASLLLLCAFAAAVAVAAPSRAVESFNVDPVHSSSVFRIKHANTAPFWGRFNDPAGSFVLDEADPSKSQFNIEIQVNNVSTGNEKRDAHLKSPDFFNAKQHPKITFKSTAVKKGEGEMLEVTGDMTMHGVTKKVTGTVELTGRGEFPPGSGMARAGVEATIVVKMSDFKMKLMPGMLSDDVKVIVALEGVKQ